MSITLRHYPLFLFSPQNPSRHIMLFLLLQNEGINNLCVLLASRRELCFPSKARVSTTSASVQLTLDKLCFPSKTRVSTTAWYELLSSKVLCFPSKTRVSTTTEENFQVIRELCFPSKTRVSTTNQPNNQHKLMLCFPSKTRVSTTITLLHKYLYRCVSPPKRGYQQLYVG